VVRVSPPRGPRDRHHGLHHGAAGTAAALQLDPASLLPLPATVAYFTTTTKRRASASSTAASVHSLLFDPTALRADSCARARSQAPALVPDDDSASHVNNTARLEFSGELIVFNRKNHTG
jgi:hypothetical protein